MHADMAHTVLLVGHSFVVGLQDHLLHAKRRSPKPNGDDPVSFPAYAIKALRCDDHFKALHFVGRRGATINQLSQFKESLTALRPTLLIVEMGTNDISLFPHRYADILRLTYNYYELTLQLLQASGASLAYICS